MEGELLDSEFVKELAEIVRWFRRNGLNAKEGRKSGTSFTKRGITFKNTESETIPPYACMEVDGTVQEDGINFVKVKKPTASAVSYIFNGDYTIEANGYGTAQSGPVFRVYKNSGTVVVNEQWAPTTGQWYLTIGSGPFVAFGTDEVDTNVFRMVFHQKGTRIKHVKAPAGGVPAFNTGTQTLGSASCTEYACTSSGVLSNNATLTCWNAAGAVAANAWGTVAQNEAGLWVWQVEKC